MIRSSHYHGAAVAVAVVASLLMFWLSIGVGIIGSDGASVNLLYAVLIALGLVGGIVVRGEDRGMVKVTAAVAAGVVVIGLLAILFGWGMPSSPPLEIAGLTSMFAAAYATASLLYARAAKLGFSPVTG